MAISRRSTLALMGGAAIGALGTSLLPHGAQAQAQRGGMLTMAVSGGSTTDSLDPATYIEIYIGSIGHAGLPISFAFAAMTEAGPGWLAS